MNDLLIEIFVTSLLFAISYYSPVSPLSLPTQYYGPKYSLFGYALSFHSEGNVTSLLVGAPKAETIQGRYGIRGPGALFECSINASKQRCIHVIFDKTGNNYDNGKLMDEKSHQWFGATVKSAGSYGIIACAPLYVFHSLNGKRKEPVGTCFLASRNFTRTSELSPCRTEKWGYHQQGFCQAGFSAAVFNDTILLGAVGSNYWQGQVFAKTLGQSIDTIQKGSNYTYDNQYFGYELAFGHFFPGPNGVSIVISAPRANLLRGHVHVISMNAPNDSRYSFVGEQIGSYFGHSISVADFNGDGLDDLLIGAPLFSTKRHFELGRVYIVLQQKMGVFRSWRILDSPRKVEARGGRFGFVVSTAGDVNGDGRADFCVSAPLHARVYVFLGRRQIQRYDSGPNNAYEPVRVLRPTNYRMNDYAGLFGYSIATHDLENDDPNVVIGEPLKDTVYLFKI